MGKCTVVYAGDLDIDVGEYTEQGPDRFYFIEVGNNYQSLIPKLGRFCQHIYCTRESSRVEFIWLINYIRVKKHTTCCKLSTGVNNVVLHPVNNVFVDKVVQPGKQCCYSIVQRSTLLQLVSNKVEQQ